MKILDTLYTKIQAKIQAKQIAKAIRTVLDEMDAEHLKKYGIPFKEWIKPSKDNPLVNQFPLAHCKLWNSYYLSMPITKRHIEGRIKDLTEDVMIHNRTFTADERELLDSLEEVLEATRIR